MVRTTVSAATPARMQAIVLSHRHFDHVGDLPPLGLSRYLGGWRGTVEIYAIQDTIDAVAVKLKGKGLPDLMRDPSPDEPVFRLNPIRSYEDFKVLVSCESPHPLLSARLASAYAVAWSCSHRFSVCLHERPRPDSNRKSDSAASSARLLIGQKRQLELNLGLLVTICQPPSRFASPDQRHCPLSGNDGVAGTQAHRS